MSAPFTQLDRALAFDPTSIGPVATAFFNSTAPVQAIMGPQGGAKTSTMFMKALRIGCVWPRSKIDGVRYCRVMVVRDTYPNLEQTALKTWHTWIPRTVGKFTAGAPHVHLLKINRQGERVLFEITFRAVGDLSAEDVFRGWEGNIVIINEADSTSPLILTHAIGRVMAGRYPGSLHGVMVPGFVMLDFNAPDEDNWTHETFVEKLPRGCAYFRQPSGLSPQAENLRNLAPGYYQNLIKGQPDWWVRRFVRNEFGYSRDGMPVYPEFSDQLHVAGAPLLADPDLPLKLGVDAGGTPALVVWQFMPNGGARALEELTSEPGTGAQPFGERTTALLARRFPNHNLRQLSAFTDPSAQYGATLGKKGDQSWFDIFSATTGIHCKPSRCNNDVTLRIESIRHGLKRPLIDHQPAMLISPNCKMLRKAFNSGYRYRRKLIAGGGYEDKPEKNHPFSDVMDAAQYGYLNGAGVKELIDRKALALARYGGASRQRLADTTGLT